MILFTGWGEAAGLFLLICHFIQDRTDIVRWWMKLRWKDQSEFAKPPMAPWSLIVVDNVWHIIQIWFAWAVLA